ncbi:MAG: SusC/RagA family TonB-linked outer membrane protein, partial [Chitinophagaceae bacterium]|nr:SusC/RagA family TonB-linked outer membrane protein [Chitinophagaceae bacterium]
MQIKSLYKPLVSGETGAAEIFTKTCPTRLRGILLVMKLTTVLLFAVMLQATAKSNAQTVTYAAESVSLEKVFVVIKQQTGYVFFYREEDIRGLPAVSVSFRNTPLGVALQETLKGQPLQYNIQGNTIFITAADIGRRKAVVPKEIISEDLAIEISGVVRDKGGAPLEGVSVTVKGTQMGTTTNADGRFQLSVSSVNNLELVFSFVGYATQTVKAGSRTVFDIVLEEAVADLNDIVVVGYGTQRRGNITGAVSSVSAKDLEDVPVATLGQRLQGKLAGVRIMQTSGRPGEGLKFQIRGAVSLTAGADPLYVIDGMPISGDINFLNADEIESISVLKDPASASLYGSRSANGVVLITTKTGKNEKVQLNFNAYYGIDKVPENRTLKMMNATQYAQFQKEIAETNGRPVDPVFENPAQYGEGTNWFKTLTRAGAIQSYNLSLSGGTQKFRTSATVGYYDQEGVIINTGFKRISLRINNQYRPTENLTIGFNIAPTQTISNNYNTDGGPYGTDNIVSSALITTPLANPYNADGTFALTASDPATFGNPNWLRVAYDKVYKDRNFKLLSN